jgi:hypothetical protein
MKKDNFWPYNFDILQKTKPVEHLVECGNLEKSGNGFEKNSFVTLSEQIKMLNKNAEEILSTLNKNVQEMTSTNEIEWRKKDINDKKDYEYLKNYSNILDIL